MDKPGMEKEPILSPQDVAKAAKFYRRGLKPAQSAIRAFLRDSPLIVYGAQATNAHLPEWLARDTKDWDIYSPSNAEGAAKRLEGMLDDRYGGDFFDVEPALHPGTYRVRAKITGEVVADISLLEKQMDVYTKDGIHYVTLDHQEKDAVRLINDPEARFRRKKDLDTLQRITVYKQVKRRGSRKQKRDGGEPYPIPSLGSIKL